MEKLTLAQLFKIYTFASTASVLAGWGGIYFWTSFGNRVYHPWTFITAIWLLFVGLPSLLGATVTLLDILGVRSSSSGKPFPQLRPARARVIPVNGRPVSLSYSAPAIPALTAADSQKRSELTLQEVEIEAGGRVISADKIAHFLRTGWARQRRGEWGLSRTWWVDQTGNLDRDEYEALVSALTAYGIVEGRKAGYSGKLALPPVMAMHRLEQQVNS